MYNILICDDEQDIVNALKIYLANPDYHLLEAHTGQEALDALERKDIHLVLLDISLPFFNGYHWCQEIRRVSKAPILFLTSASDNVNVVMAMQLGGDDLRPFPRRVQLAGLFNRVLCTHNGFLYSSCSM